MVRGVIMDRDLLFSLYRDMIRIRRFEEEAARCYTRGKIGGFLHLYNGEEAVAVGSISAIEPTDYILATYREHAHYLARVGDMNAAMAELYGKATGCAKGRGGSMHFFDASKRFMGGHAIVGGHIPIAAGIAFAAKYRGEPDVTLCFFGEGTANMGAFHEGMSLAALWKLPLCAFVKQRIRWVRRSIGLWLLKMSPCAQRVPNGARNCEWR